MARTRMGQNVCVGAAAESDGASLRLVPAASPKHHGWRSFDATIGSLLEIDGGPASATVPPHVEDYLVSNWRATGSEVGDLAEWIRSKVFVREGDPDTLFEGLLGSEPTGSRWLDPGHDLPSGSVEFWRLPFEIYRRQPHGDKPGCTYAAAMRHGFRVKYVGLAPEVESVPEGTLVRVSLARAWSREVDEGARCWLQLSGWYPAKGVQLVERPAPTAANPPASNSCDDDIPF